jgi:putative transposase
MARGNRLAQDGGVFHVTHRCHNRMHAFWGDNYHATLVDSGEYLWKCLCYIELNMVRCKVVDHPREWPWVGYHEIMGLRQRYRLIDLDRLTWRLGTAAMEDVRCNLEASLGERISRGQLKREPCWTESLAVGRVAFLEKIKPQILSRHDTEIIETVKDVWVLRENPIPYGQKEGSKSGAKTLN